MFLKNRMVVGFELNNDYSQLSFSTFDQSMPDTLSLVNGEEEYNIKTALLAKRSMDAGNETKITFSVGRDFEKKQSSPDNYLIDDLFGIMKNDASVMIGDKTFTASDLFKIYIKKCLAYLPSIGRSEEIVGISFTTNELSTKFMDTIKQSITEIPVYFLDKQECFYQYMLNQPAEIKVHDCLLFELKDKELKAVRLFFNNRTRPVAGLIEEKSFMIQERTYEDKDEAFETVIKEISANRIITSSFLIGEGFSKEWCKNSLKELCRLGRAFQGNNLYSKGACYLAKEKISPTSNSTDFVFLGEDKLKVNVGIYVTDRGEDKYLPLLHAGTNWYEAGFEQDFMLANDNAMTLHISPLNGDSVNTKDITLEYFDIRNNYTNRINFKLSMKEKDLMHIEVKDLGFGDIFPSKGTVWKDDIRV